MQFLIPTTLIAWIPFCLLMFATLPRRRAVVIGIVGAWLFLPPSGIPLSGLPDYTKSAAFSYGIMLGTLMFMPDRVIQFRPHWLDLTMISFCLSPFASSLSNGLGAYDGISVVLSQLTTWGLPYLVGRLHFRTEEELRDLVVGIVVGGLVYVPFCVYEMRMSPLLLNKLYGIGVFMASRLGGWRPRVFFADGLELGMWMTVSCLCAVWMWWRRSLTTLWGYSFGAFFLPVIVVVTVLCRSSGAMMLLMAGLAVLWFSVQFRSRLLMLALVLGPIIYIAVRVPNVWDYSGLVDFLSQNFSSDRAESLAFRFKNEDILIAKAIQMPVFGWGGWGRSRVFNEDGVDVSITDGLWIIIMGPTGVVGLCSYLAVFVLPGLVFIWRYPARRWGDRDLASQTAVVCFIGIYMIDCLLNAFVSSIYVAALGGLVSCLRSGVGFPAADPDEERLEFEYDHRPTGGHAPAPGSGLADLYIEAARDYRRAGQDDKASSAWRLAHDLLVRQSLVDPDDPDRRRRRFDCANDFAWFLLSRTSPGPGDRAEAVSLARQATQADPDNPTYWNTLAAALCRVGDDQAAIVATRRGLALESAVPSGFDFAVLALAHARLGRREEAARQLAEAREWRERSRGRSPVLDDLIDEAQAALVS